MAAKKYAVFASGDQTNNRSGFQGIPVEGDEDGRHTLTTEDIAVARSAAEKIARLPTGQTVLLFAQIGECAAPQAPVAWTQTP